MYHVNRSKSKTEMSYTIIWISGRKFESGNIGEIAIKTKMAEIFRVRTYFAKN